jgi:hypothetical protein
MSNYWLAEIFLTLAALLVASRYWLISRNRFQSPALLITAGLLCLALASAAGAYRYGVDPGMAGLHGALSRLSGYISFLLVGLGLLWARLDLPFGFASRAPAYATLALVIGSALAAAESAQLSTQNVGTLFSTLGILLWILVAAGELFRNNLTSRQALLLAAGALLVILAGLYIGSDSTSLFGLARINWFHLVLGAALLSLLYARPLFAHRGEKSDG